MDLHAHDDPCLSMQCSQRLPNRACQPWFGCTRLFENWGKAQERRRDIERDKETRRTETRDTHPRDTKTHSYSVHTHSILPAARTTHHTARSPPRDFLCVLPPRRGNPGKSRADENSYGKAGFVRAPIPFIIFASTLDARPFIGDIPPACE